MITNLGKVAAATRERQQASTESTIRAVAHELPTLTWARIESQLTECKQYSATYNKEIVAALESENKELLDAEAVVKKLDASTKETRKALMAAMDDAAKWQARQILFRESLVLVAENARTNTSLTDEVLVNAAKDILNQEMTVTTLNTDGEIVPTQTTVGKQLKGSVSNLKALDLGTLLREYTIDIADPKSAPGLTVVILSLADDLARIEKQRAKLEVKHLSARLALLQAAPETDRSCQAAWQIVHDRTAEGDFKPNAKPVHTINVLKGREDERPLQDAFNVLAHYSIARVLNTARRDDLRARLAILEHEYAIREAQVNAEERAAVVSRGLEGLVAYHGGGLTAEDVANFLRAAQTAALGAVAIGVN
jgi:hypothetical protein